MADKQIDPRIYMPPVEGYEYIDRTAEGGDSAPSDEVLDIPITTTGLQPPESVQVVEQIFRKGADGRTVVDLVVEVQDMPGATEYEVRISTV